MKKSCFLALILLFVISAAYAEDCQYKESVVDHCEVKMLAVDSFGNPIQDVKVEVPSDWSAPVRIINPNPVDVSLDLNIRVIGKNQLMSGPESFYCPANAITPVPATVLANAFVDISPPSIHPSPYCNQFKFLNEYTITYRTSEFVTVAATNVCTNKTICKQCNGKTCLNDGAACSFDSACGAGICPFTKRCNSFTCPGGTLNYNSQTCLNLYNLALFIAILFVLFMTGYYIYRRVTREEKEFTKKLELLKKDLAGDKSEEEKLKELNDFERMVASKCILKTHGTHKVQSYGEQQIYNFLSDNKIDFDYDTPITLNGERIRPDFQLNEHNIVIEYWGMARDPKGSANMEKKKRIYLESNKKLISIYPKQVLDKNEFESLLKEKLKSHSVFF